MKKAAVFLIFLALVSCATYRQNVNLQGMPAGAPIERVAITLESYRITPDAIKVKAGTHVIIDLVSPSAKHELVIEKFGIHVTVPKGGSAVAEFYAGEPGAYDFGCHLGLGLHYTWGMKGTLTVTP